MADGTGKRDWEFGILGAIVLALLLGLLCKFCVICPCSDCGEGMSYDEQSQLCCDSSKGLCCPSGARPCNQLQGCSELQVGCQSGCCTDKCECLMPPVGKNVTWTACRAGYSDCNSDGNWDCNTTNSSNACFGGICDISSDSSPPPLGICLEGWSDCDNDESTGIALEGGAGCECNTGAGFTCCGGECVSTPLCQNPPMGCNSTNPCCSGWGCVMPTDSNIGQCRPCNEFSGNDCSECPAGCSFDELTGGCGSCVNPTICGDTDKCCCGYECNASTNKCDLINAGTDYGCVKPESGECPSAPCCAGEGCLDGECEPCSDFSGTDINSCPIGCGFDSGSGSCAPCSKLDPCSRDEDCCNRYVCNPITRKCNLLPSCDTAFQECSMTEDCCQLGGVECKSVTIQGDTLNRCCYTCREGVESDCCDESGNSYTDTYTDNCPVRCGGIGCKVACDGEGRCPAGEECCSNNDDCGVCGANGLCGGIGPRECTEHGDSDCAAPVCRDGICGAGEDGSGGDWKEPEGCASNDQCFICDASNNKCGGTGEDCATDSDCLLSSCLDGICESVGCLAIGDVCLQTSQCCQPPTSPIGLSCAGGVCAACVSDSETCSSESDCCSGLCVGGKCCGGIWSCCSQENVACTKNEDCCAGMICSDNKCAVFVG